MGMPVMRALANHLADEITDGQLGCMQVQVTQRQTNCLQYALDEITAPTLDPYVIYCNGNRFIPVLTQVPQLRTQGIASEQRVIIVWGTSPLAAATCELLTA